MFHKKTTAKNETKLIKKIHTKTEFCTSCRLHAISASISFRFFFFLFVPSDTYLIFECIRTHSEAFVCLDSILVQEETVSSYRCMNIAPYGASKLCSQFRCVLWFVGNLFIFCYFFVVVVVGVSVVVDIIVVFGLFRSIWFWWWWLLFYAQPIGIASARARIHRITNRKNKIVHAERWCADGHESGPRSFHLITNSPICFPFIDSEDQHFTFVSMYIIYVHIAWLKHTHILTPNTNKHAHTFPHKTIFTHILFSFFYRRTFCMRLSTSTVSFERWKQIRNLFRVKWISR